MSTFTIKNKVALIAVGTALSVLPATVMATNGYFSHGVGIKAKAMAGAGIARSSDSLAAGTNPANMVKQGNRIDFGLDVFRPDRDTEIVGNSGGSAINSKYSPNSDDTFLIPEFGYNQMLNETMSFGVSVYGNGGMNTSYNKPIALFGGSTNAGVNLEQLFIAPTFSMKVNDKNTFGVSLNAIYQKFRATGLQGFATDMSSSAKDFVTDKGDDTSTGFNIRLGWTMEVSDMVTLGATYQSEADMDKFDKYKGLFAEQGDFDIPSTYGIGISIAPSKDLFINFDITKINYSDVAAISNKNPGTERLGGDNGSGFGWEDMTVFKLGAAYDLNSTMTLLAGWNYAEQPIPDSQTFFNLLAPGVVESHFTAGLTMELENKSELTFSFMYAPEVTVSGKNSIAGASGGGEANISMSQTSFGVGYGWNF